MKDKNPARNKANGFFMHFLARSRGILFHLSEMVGFPCRYDYGLFLSTCKEV